MHLTHHSWTIITITKLTNEMQAHYTVHLRDKSFFPNFLHNGLLNLIEYLREKLDIRLLKCKSHFVFSFTKYRLKVISELCGCVAESEEQMFTFIDPTVVNSSLHLTHP